MKNQYIESNIDTASHNEHLMWSNFHMGLKTHFGDDVYKSWFTKLSFLTLTDQKFTLTAPTQFIRDWIKANYLSTMVDIAKLSYPSLSEIEIIIDTNLGFNDNHSPIDLNEQNVESETKEILSSNLDPRFTFNNFVVGNPNELAYAAAYAVAESKKAIAESNPLFLYGGVGLGKTHLMHAIAWHIKQNNPQRKVIYMSAEKFMYQFVKALRDKDVMSFKEKFRSVDVLMIDDIQFICGKESTQEEFFHTFNALIDNNRQMVISCDRSPTDLDNIEERIKSRLGWGLVADVHSTTYELRLGILQSKVEQLKISIPLNVLEFLASKITSNVRELEGALNKVIAHSTLVGREINVSNCKDLLKDLIRSNEKYVTIDEVQKKVAEQYNIKISDMSSSRRHRSVARPRQVAMYLSKILTTKSLCDIGKKFGKKDHTTVLHACKQIEKLKLSDYELQEELNLLQKALQG
jgi:chromosomal replication initiator protein